MPSFHLLIFPDLMKQKNIALRPYKKYFTEIRGNVYTNKVCTMNVYKNNRIKHIGFRGSTYKHRFNKTGEFSCISSPVGYRVYISLQTELTSLPINMDFRKTMKDHGIITFHDFIKEENRDIINFYTHMFSIPYFISDKPFMEFLDEKHHQNEL